MVGSLPRQVCAGCGQWPVWPAAPVSGESTLEVAFDCRTAGLPPAFGVHDDALYKSTAFTFVYLYQMMMLMA